MHFRGVFLSMPISSDMYPIDITLLGYKIAFNGVTGVKLFPYFRPITGNGEVIISARWGIENGNSIKEP